jgi:hypothetical protein
VYTEKLGIYNPSEDDILLINVTVLMVDDQLCDDAATLFVHAILDLNYNDPNLNGDELTADQSLIITRTGGEQPMLNLYANIINNTNIVFDTK